MNQDTGLRKSFYGKTKAEAEEKAWRSFGITEDTTLYSYYVSVYLPSIGARSLNWRRQVAWAWDKYIGPKFAKADISEIRRQDLQRFYNGITTLNPSSLAKVKIVFSGILNLAVDDEVIPRNPNTSTRLPPTQDPDVPSLSAEDLMTLVKACPDRVKPFVVLCGLLGLRKGEACGVTWHSIKGNYLEVRQQIRDASKGVEISPTLKTPQSQRRIYVPDSILDLLDCNQVSDIWVCSNTTGGYLTPNNAVRELNKVLADLEMHVTPHGLRHSFISILENELECPDAIAAALTGRAKRGKNASYSHAKPAQLEAWMKKFWNHVSTAGGTIGRVQAVSE